MTPPPLGTVAADPYNHFVSDSDDAIDVVDHVAYSLYKRDKLAFSLARQKATGAVPDRAEMDVFVCASTLESKISTYRAEAQQILQGFCEAVLTTASEEEEERLRKHFHDELKKARPFWRNMVENMFANMLALALTAIVVVAVYGTRISAISLIGDIFGYDIKERPAAQLTAQPQPAASTPR